MSETTVGAIPRLSDEDIQARVGAQSFQRGRQYFRDRSIFDARQQGMTLKARCHGSSGGPYWLRVTFGPDGIADAHCSCPVGAGGYCKHIAALLLTWRDRPDDFLAVEELDATLKQRSKEELIALVKQMLRQEPELESLLEVPLPAAGKRSAPVDPEVYRRRAQSVFSAADDRWDDRRGTSHSVERGLMAILSIGEGFVRQQDYAGAAAVYEGVTLEALEHFEEYDDESGSFSDVIYECVDGLGECLKNGKDPTVREQILRTLFAIYQFDVKWGGIGLSDGALDLMVDETTPEERRTMAAWVRAAMPQGGGSSADWRRGAYGGFLLDLEMDTLDDEAYLRVCRDTGRIHDLTDRLLQLGRVDEAVQVAEAAADYDLLHQAAIFVRHDQAALAVRLMEERAKTTQDTRIHEWLKDRYKTQGDLPRALELAEKLFRTTPDLRKYQELRELSRQTGRWEDLRPDLLRFLRDRGWHDLLVTVHLEDGEPKEALQALRQARSGVMRYGYGLYGGESLALQVARAVAPTQPHDALGIYAEQVEHLIAGRNRTLYAEAARLLVQMCEIYERIGEDEAWLTYIEDLRQRYRSLRALKEEMAAAGL